MNHRLLKRSGGALLAGGLLMVGTGCDDLLQVRNPGIIDAATIDLVEHSQTFSLSAWTSFARSYGDHVVYTAWFTNEMWVGDSFPTRNDFGRRQLDDRNSTYNADVYQPLAQALAQSDDAADVALTAVDAARADQNEALETRSRVDLSRARVAAGFSLVLMGEAYCRGTIKDGRDHGPALSWQQVLGEAIGRFDDVIGTAAALSGAEARSFHQAAHVGAARASLQRGEYAQAIAYASGVEKDFELTVAYVDQAGTWTQRLRLGNRAFQFGPGGARESFVVPPHYREMGVRMADAEAVTDGDPRITYFDSGRNAQDNELRLWGQLKYPNWASHKRLASYLEAQYIIAEAEYHLGNPAPAMALIDERRAVGGQGGFAGTGEAVLRELMDQRSRDFWLEAKRMGDFRRNPGAVPNILEPGVGSYYKDVQGGLVDNQTCWPMPFSEWNANPHIQAD
jgi:starch-binding outer membrane protein, SusD/RagB family